ncbi:MAG: FecR domain-containing protein [Candidatus Binatia bacterium]
MNPGERSHILEQAAAWALRLQNGALTRSERAALECWRAADPRHDSAFLLAQQSWADLAGMKRAPGYDDLLDPPTLRERVLTGWTAWTPVPIAAAALLALLIGAGIFFWGGMSSGIATHETRVAQIEKVDLADGTIVTLGGDSRIEVTFSRQQRRVDLVRGEALFQVAKDAARPFLVRALDATVRVVGTQFDVRRGEDQLCVAVLEGVVEVVPPAPDRAASSSSEALHKRVIMPRQQIVANTGQWDTASVSGVNADAFASWRTGRLFYDGVPLREVVADLNRYYRGHIRVASEELGAMRVTTSFRVGQIDQMIATLAIALPLTAERAPNGDIGLREKRNGD